MNATEKLNKIMETLGLAKSEPQVEEIEVKEEVVELMEDEKVEEPKEEPVQEAVQPSYATMEQLTAVKEELLSLIEANVEVTKKETKEVPQELSAQEPKEKEEVELSEEPVEEIKHSPENDVENEGVKLSYKPFAKMTIEERIAENWNKLKLK